MVTKPYLNYPYRREPISSPFRKATAKISLRSNSPRGCMCFVWMRSLADDPYVLRSASCVSPWRRRVASTRFSRRMPSSLGFLRLRVGRNSWLKRRSACSDLTNATDSKRASKSEPIGIRDIGSPKRSPRLENRNPLTKSVLIRRDAGLIRYPISTTTHSCVESLSIRSGSYRLVTS